MANSVNGVPTKYGDRLLVSWSFCWGLNLPLAFLAWLHSPKVPDPLMPDPMMGLSRPLFMAMFWCIPCSFIASINRGLAAIVTGILGTFLGMVLMAPHMASHTVPAWTPETRFVIVVFVGLWVGLIVALLTFRSYCHLAETSAINREVPKLSRLHMPNDPLLSEPTRHKRAKRIREEIRLVGFRQVADHVAQVTRHF